MSNPSKTTAMFNVKSVREAAISAIGKLTPRQQWKNPVMFVVYLGSLLTTILWLNSLNNPSDEPSSFILAITLWLWFTVLFANFAEAMAEGRSKAQAAFLRSAKRDIIAKKLDEARYGGNYSKVTGAGLRKEDVVLVEAGDFIPGDGDVIEGVATVDESAITGESAPVIRESGGDFSSVTGGTRVLSDWLVVRISANPGEAFLDKMIAMVESASRQKTPNEIALTILLVALTLVFLMATVTLLPFSLYSVQSAGAGQPITITVLVALLVCLIPTTIGGLLSAIGVAGIGRMMQKNVIATSGRAVEAAGDVDVLLLDKTGTITLGNRQASAFIPVQGVSEQQLADAAQLASLADETPEGRSIVVLAKQKFGIRERDVQSLGATFIHFSAQTRMSGVNLPSPSGREAGGEGRQIRKGAEDAIRSYVTEQGGSFPDDIKKTVVDVARRGSTPLVVAEGKRALGVIELKDIVKGGIKERFIELRQMGIKTIMITGDNRLTAAAIAAEAGVDDFLAEATPEAKLKLIRQHQSDGRLVAMTGDGTNDAPALAQADVAVAMNSGTQAAKEAGNMVDLDSNPTKLIEIVETGKQMLMTRGALTTFSIANDVAKYFAIIPAAFATTYPALNVLNVMHLATPSSAILSAVIFNALIIIALIPLALKGIRYRPVGAANLLQNNLLVYGVGGLIVPFIGIKLIDVLLVSLSLV
jgi:potassium-transporting ATPase ATP-binding subunit